MVFGQWHLNCTPLFSHLAPSGQGLILQGSTPARPNVLCQYQEIQLGSIQKTLQRIDERSEKIEGAIFDLQQENEKLRKQVGTLMIERQDLKEENERMKTSLRRIKMQRNHLEQWTRKWNIRIWGLKDDETETVGNCMSKVISFFQCELGLTNFAPDRLDVAHRLGRYRQSQNRAVIVRFLHLTDRTLVLQTKARLIGGPFGIAEDLTAENHKLLGVVREKAGKGNAWSRDGTIFARLQSGRVVKVDEATPLSDYFDTSPTSGSSHPMRSRNTVWQTSGPSHKNVHPNTRPQAAKQHRPGEGSGDRQRPRETNQAGLSAAEGGNRAREPSTPHLGSSTPIRARDRKKLQQPHARSHSHPLGGEGRLY